MNLINSLKHYACSALEKVRVRPTLGTAREDLRGFVNRMPVISTGVPLRRIGSAADGGYLLPDDLEGVVGLFSPGVSNNSDFELEFARLGMNVYLADGSVDSPAIDHPLFHFRKKFIGAHTDHNFLTLDDWFDQSSAIRLIGDFALQMDIEGWEYQTILSTSNRLLERFRIIIIEFHRLHLVASEPVFQFYDSVFRKILQTHSCVHFHPNNVDSSDVVSGLEIPRVAELTFYRNDRILRRGKVLTLPHPLDADNTPNASLKLDPQWHLGWNDKSGSCM